MLFKKQLFSYCEKEYKRQGLPYLSSYKEFISHYFQHFVEADHQVDQLDYFFQATAKHFKLVSTHNPKKIQITLVKAKTSEIPQRDLFRLYINYPDIPFLIESIKSLFARIGAQVEQNNVMANFITEKSARKISFVPVQEGGASYLWYDIDAGQFDLSELKTQIQATTEDVQCIVKDWRRMQDTLRNIMYVWRDTPSSVVPEDLMQEYIAFMEWFVHHFTFLSYHGYRIQNGKKILSGEKWGLAKSANHLEFFGPKVSFPKQVNHEVFPLIMMTHTEDISTVHRNVHKDLLVIRVYNQDQKLVEEHYFSGLLTADAYETDPSRIPLIRRRFKEALTAYDLRASFSRRRMEYILKSMPREELFQSDITVLAQAVFDVFMILERRVVRLFIRNELYSNFYSIMVFIPRDVFSTKIRMSIQHYFEALLNSKDMKYTPFLAESSLTRLYFVFRCDPTVKVKKTIRDMQQDLTNICASWDDGVSVLVRSKPRTRQELVLAGQFIDHATEQYKNSYKVDDASIDIDFILKLNGKNPVEVNIHEQNEGSNLISIKLYQYVENEVIPLTVLFPVLSNLGFDVVHQSHFEEEICEKFYHISEFKCNHHFPNNEPIACTRDELCIIIKGVLNGSLVNDSFNSITTVCGMSIREVNVIRALCVYLTQIKFPLSISRLSAFFTEYPQFTRALMRVFNTRFQPKVRKRDQLYKRFRKEAQSCCEEVKSSDDERVILAVLNLVDSIVRTNYCIPNQSALAFKIESANVANIPKPSPMFEFFVFSSRVLGVHIRFSRTARGGVRNSDRINDVRHEVFELAKTQRLKNTLIVPDGAKGGFVCLRLFENGDIDRGAEVVECYKIFIRSMLSLVDNIGRGHTLHPSVVVHDDPDPYFVVAADKGTATFSGYANEISNQMNFWLGDAFASGGQYGYDHKKMGITAKGAWESVKWHFSALQKNVYHDPFTVVGIGDMSGDVFGNGLLLSDKIQLVGAFNHLYIFVDPTPDEHKSYHERLRLFQTPDSQWTDYDKTLISAGGGVFDRKAKYITVTPQMKKKFGISKQKIEPNELIQDLLKSKVDLIWNGGIGVYVKSSSETNFDVMDFHNDGCRINASDMHTKIFAEGGNNGLTQSARIEYSKNGGIINTDFIDNSAGVNTSDVEVNFKILFQQLMKQERLTFTQRNAVLNRLSHQVSTSVLKNNFLQNIQINLGMIEARTEPNQYIQFIDFLEKEALLNRQLERLPSKSELKERKKHLELFTRPEMAVLLSYSKIWLYAYMNSLPLVKSTLVTHFLYDYFPQSLTKKYQEQIKCHSLRDQIVATEMTNTLICEAGILFVSQLCDECNVDAQEVIHAYYIVRRGLNLSKSYNILYGAADKVDHVTLLYLLGSLRRTIYRSARYILRNYNISTVKQVEKVIALFEPLQGNMSCLEQLPKKYIHRMAKIQIKLEDGNIKAVEAARICSLRYAYQLFAMQSIASNIKCDVADVIKIYYAVASAIRFHRMRERLTDIQSNSRWEVIQKSVVEDDCGRVLERLTQVIVVYAQDHDIQISSALECWVDSNDALFFEIKRSINELNNLRKLDLSVFAVILDRILSSLEGA